MRVSRCWAGQGPGGSGRAWRRGPAGELFSKPRDSGTQLGFCRTSGRNIHATPPPTALPQPPLSCQGFRRCGLGFVQIPSEPSSFPLRGKYRACPLSRAASGSLLGISCLSGVCPFLRRAVAPARRPLCIPASRALSGDARSPLRPRGHDPAWFLGSAGIESFASALSRAGPGSPRGLVCVTSRGRCQPSPRRTCPLLSSAVSSRPDLTPCCQATALVSTALPLPCLPCRLLSH